MKEYYDLMVSYFEDREYSIMNHSADYSYCFMIKQIGFDYIIGLDLDVRSQQAKFSEIIGMDFKFESLPFSYNHKDFKLMEEEFSIMRDRVNLIWINEIRSNRKERRDKWEMLIGKN